ncbi:MAG: glutamyl-tRNA reductase [Planctomycetes bacterium]|nr:glutamyl-tRNA reductase [Planctomycetota bacterium]
MDSKVSLALIGLSHRTAPLGTRERYVVSQHDLPEVLRALKQVEGMEEVCVISTCNRTEVVVIGRKGLDLSAHVRAQLFRNLPDEQVYAFEDVHALIHLFRVAAGLDSVVIGESEILGQMKRGMEAALSNGTLGSVLKPLMQQALHVGKRVRSETEVGQGTLSVARVGVDMAERVFGRFGSVRALIAGAGETGVLVARHLKEKGVGDIVFANRTLERAAQAAAEFGGRAFPLSDLPALTNKTDILIACIEAETASIDASAFDARSLRRRDRPLLVIDLSVPRAVAPEVAQLDNVILYDLDVLQEVVQKNLAGRAGATDTTASILVGELHKFLALRTYASFSPAIAQMRERFEKARDEVLDSVAGAQSSPETVRLAHELTKKQLDIALDSMKLGARHTRSEESLSDEYRRFLENL